MVQELIKAQNDNVKAIVLEVFKEREACSKTYRKGIAEMGTDSEGERIGKLKIEGLKDGALAPDSNNMAHARAPEVSIPPSILPPPAHMIASQHHYPPPYAYYPPYQYPSGHLPQGYSQPPPQGYSQPPPRTEGAFYSVNFFHR